MFLLPGDEDGVENGSTALEKETDLEPFSTPSSSPGSKKTSFSSSRSVSFSRAVEPFSTPSSSPGSKKHPSPPLDRSPSLDP